MNRRLKSQSGFTLVEIIVSTFVFSIIMLVVSGLFVQILANERRGFAAQQIQENGLYIMEQMAREIRVSQIQNQDSLNCSATTLTIIHPVNGTVTYAVSNGVLQRTVNGVTTNISSSSIKFSRFNFCIMGSNPTDKTQARVAILAAIQNTTNGQTLTFNLETTISSRDVSTEFAQ